MFLIYSVFICARRKKKTVWSASVCDISDYFLETVERYFGVRVEVHLDKHGSDLFGTDLFAPTLKTHHPALLSEMAVAKYVQVREHIFENATPKIILAQRAGQEF